MELRQYIATKMEQRGITQKAVASKVDKDQSTVSNWLNGVYDIPLDELPNIAEAIQEKTPIKLYSIAGLFAALPDSARRLIDMMHDATPDEIDVMERLAEALIRKQQ